MASEEAVEGFDERWVKATPVETRVKVQRECWCTAPRYDGDDGWDRDCSEHGIGRVIG